MIKPWKALFDAATKTGSRAWRMPPYVMATDGHRLVALDGDDATLPDCDPKTAAAIREWLATETPHRADRAALLAWCGDLSLVPCEKCKGTRNEPCECGGTGHRECEQCGGDGRCTCGCGDEHECAACHGKGSYPCNCAADPGPCYHCRSTGSMARTSPGRVAGVVVNRPLLGQMLALADAPEVQMGAGDRMLVVKWAGGAAVLMAYLGHEAAPTWDGELPEVPR